MARSTAFNKTVFPSSTVELVIWPAFHTFRIQISDQYSLPAIKDDCKPCYRSL